MASAAGPIPMPMSPAIKRSTRKRQRPAFFADEIASSSAPATTRKHATSNQRATRPRPKQPTPQPTTPPSRPPARRAARSDLAELHDTVASLRTQIESASEQMEELRSLVTLLATLYRQDDSTQDEPALFSTTSSEHDSVDTDDVFSTTASEHDGVYEEDDWLKTPLSPL